MRREDMWITFSPIWTCILPGSLSLPCLCSRFKYMQISLAIPILPGERQSYLDLKLWKILSSPISPPILLNSGEDGIYHFHPGWKTIYISLGGNRRGIYQTYLNLMITMILGGLWHGANWTFIIWGILHGVYLAVHKFVIRGKKIVSENKPLKSLSDILHFLPSNILSYLLIVLTWLFFRVKGLDVIHMFIMKCSSWTWAIIRSGSWPS